MSRRPSTSRPNVNSITAAAFSRPGQAPPVTAAMLGSAVIELSSSSRWRARRIRRTRSATHGSTAFASSTVQWRSCSIGLGKFYPMRPHAISAVRDTGDDRFPGPPGGRESVIYSGMSVMGAPGRLALAERFVNAELTTPEALGDWLAEHGLAGS